MPDRGVIIKKVFINNAELSDTIPLRSFYISKSFNKVSFAKVFFHDGDPSRRDFLLSNDDKFKPGNDIKIQIGDTKGVDTVFEGIIVRHTIRARQNQPSYLMIEAKPVQGVSTKIHPAEESVADVAKNVEQYAAAIGPKLNHWKTHLESMKADGKKVAVWGSGSKCVAFLTTLNTLDLIDCIVDINPYRQGKFIPGVAQEIKSPEALKAYKPDEIILMNGIYRDEIQKMLDEMGVVTTIVAI